MEAFTLLGAVPKSGLYTWLIATAMQKGLPWVNSILADPGGTVERVGDLLVWNGVQGQTVLAGLEALNESQARVNTAIAGIEQAQLVIAGSLGVVGTISAFTLGITSLSSAYMFWRLATISNRLAIITKQINDIDVKLDAEARARVKTSLQRLQQFENNGDERKLSDALELASLSANAFAELAAHEADNQKRLILLNYRSRLYVLSLLTELHCHMLEGHIENAISRIDQELENLQLVAKCFFDKVLGSTPERYLSPDYQKFNINLSVLRDVYWQASQLGIISEPFPDDNATFEHLRGGLGARWPQLFPLKNIPQNVADFRYLLACLEEGCRLISLRLMAKECHERKASVSALFDLLKRWKGEQLKKAAEDSSYFAYSFTG